MLFVLAYLFLSPTHEGKRHNKKIADSTPYPLPEAGILLQGLGFLAF